MKTIFSNFQKLAMLLCVMLSACTTSPPPAIPGGPAVPVPITLGNLNVTKNFPAASVVTGTNGALPGAIIVTDQSFAGLEGNNNVTYDAASKSFTLSISQDAFTYNQEFSRIDQAASIPEETVYLQDDERFIVQKAGVANKLNPALVFDYVTYGYWVADNISGFGEASGWITYGFQSAPADMPTSGSVNYTGVAEGKLYRFGDLYTVYGDVEIEANFTSATITADFSGMMQQKVLAGGSLGTAGLWRDFTASGSIATGTSRYSGTSSTLNGVYQGSFSGGFFGPAGAAPTETGGIWSLTGAGENATGAFIAKK